MSVPKVHIPALIVALVATSSVFGISFHEGIGVNQASAASAQQKGQARQSLDQVMRLLQAVDTAYASGNSAEAKTRFQRSLGWLLDDAGLAPHEAPWHIVLKQSDLQLRRYGQQAETAGPVLIVPAPIKHIFDLLPEVSVIRRLTEAGFSVYLSEWCEEESA